MPRKKYRPHNDEIEAAGDTGFSRALHSKTYLRVALVSVLLLLVCALCALALLALQRFVL